MESKKTLILGMVFLLAGTALLLAVENEPVDPVNWRELTPFLTDIKGWDAEDEAEGSSVSMMNFKISQAERDYSDGNRDLTITIIDGGYVPMAYAGFKMYMNYEVDTSDEYVKGVTIEGFPGVERYTYDDKNANITLLLNERFLVTLDGYEFEDTSDLIDIAKELDLNGIAALAE